MDKISCEPVLPSRDFEAQTRDGCCDYKANSIKEITLLGKGKYTRASIG
jgi:hypothetical protein